MEGWSLENLVGLISSVKSKKALKQALEQYGFKGLKIKRNTKTTVIQRIILTMIQVSKFKEDETDVVAGLESKVVRRAAEYARQRPLKRGLHKFRR